ncbi:MAG TPA: sulfotransferase, partial [Solirubrobacteraceae bacterium]
MRDGTTAPSGPERPKVVYVMGAGHSGSTILGITLGNCDRFFYAGEVEEWLVKSGQPPWAGSERSQFWSTVTEQVEGEDLFGAEVNRVVERSSAVLRIDRWARRRRLLPRYREVSGQLLGAIAATADATHVIDTSHFPLRARELAGVEGIDLYLLFLVKDPQSVVASNTRELSPHELAERRYRALVMNANLWLTQLVSVLVFLRHPRRRRLFVRYEQFIADPEGVLRQILDAVDSDA